MESKSELIQQRPHPELSPELIREAAGGYVLIIPDFAPDIQRTAAYGEFQKQLTDCQATNESATDFLYVDPEKGLRRGIFIIPEETQENGGAVNSLGGVAVFGQQRHPPWH